MKSLLFFLLIFFISFMLPAQDLVVDGKIGVETNNPSEAIDLKRKRNIRFDYTHLGETGDALTTVLANKARVSQSEDRRVDYAYSNADGVSAIALNYLYGISFFTRPTDVSNPTTEGDEFFSFDNRTYERMRITGDGRVGINTTYGQASPNGTGVHGHSIDGKGIVGESENGTGVVGDGFSCDFDAIGAGTNYCTTSSKRWKRNIHNISNPLMKLSKLRGVSFTWDKEHGGHDDIGFIAEEVGEVLPSIVVYESNGIDASSMDYSMMTPLLVEVAKAMRKEYQDKFKEQEARISSLEAELSEIKALLKAQVKNVGED